MSDTARIWYTHTGVYGYTVYKDKLALRVDDVFVRVFVQ